MTSAFCTPPLGFSTTCVQGEGEETFLLIRTALSPAFPDNCVMKEEAGLISITLLIALDIDVDDGGIW